MTEIYVSTIQSTGTLQLFAIMFLVMIWVEWIKQERLSCFMEERYIIMEANVFLWKYRDKKSFCFQYIER